MTDKPEKPLGERVKTVRKLLADGTVKEYRYSRTKRQKRIRPEQGAIRQIADLYAQSPEFLKLSKRWQGAKHFYLRLLEAELGWLTIDDLNDRSVRGDFYELRDRYAERQDKADKLIDTLKGMLGWAYERNRLAYNHALGIPHLAPSGQRRSEIIWTEDNEAVVYSTFPRPLVEAFRFALFSAARQADMCRLKWENYRDGWITYRQSKTGATVRLPVFALPPFQELIKSLSRSSEFMLTTATGHPMDVAHLGKSYRQAYAKSELKPLGLRWHDLRGTASTRLAEAGCTDAEVAAITGHSIGPGTKLGDYVARSRTLALHAYEKWAKAMEGPQIVTLETRRGNRKL